MATSSINGLEAFKNVNNPQDWDALLTSITPGTAIIATISSNTAVGYPSDFPYKYGTLITIRATGSPEWGSIQMYLVDSANPSTALYVRSGASHNWVKLTGASVTPTT